MQTRYCIYAEQARKDGYEQIAAIFEDTAHNENQHAKQILKRMGEIYPTQKALSVSAEGEHYEWAQLYRESAITAQNEGFPEIATLFNHIADAEDGHEVRFRKLLSEMEAGQVFSSPNEVQWRCRNCGYIHTGTDAPGICPLCQVPQAYFQKTQADA